MVTCLQFSLESGNFPSELRGRYLLYKKVQEAINWAKMRPVNLPVEIKALQ